jgi:hypothetical protein
MDVVLRKSAKHRIVRRAALGIGAMSALLVACGAGNHSGSGALPDNVPRDTPAHQKTFKYTGTKQSFTVPGGVTSITVDVLGAAGAPNVGECERFKYGVGRGGRVFAVIPVVPHQRLAVFVGGDGSSGGYNGGGLGSNYGAGGGASDVRVGAGGLSDRIIVAGGGGGEGGGDNVDINYYGCGGGGGGLVAGQGEGGYGTDTEAGGGGSGGTQSAGGAGGQAGEGSGPSCKANGYAGGNGARGIGGIGAKSGGSAIANGGGGGGGYFGGGGGGSGADCYDSYSQFDGGGGGGGGSSYVEPSATQVRMWRNWHLARSNGLVVLRWQ